MQSHTFAYAARLALRIVLLASLLVACLSGAALLVAGLLAWSRGNSWGDPVNFFSGLVCSLIGLLFVAVFHIRRESFELPLRDKEGFIENTRTILSDLGYEMQRPQTPGHWAFKPGLQSYLLGGKVGIWVRNDHARVSGPKVCLEMLRHRLRFQSHLDKARQPGPEERRLGERLLKRVQVSMRVGADRLGAVQAQVTGTLPPGTEVICDVNLLVQGEAGIREQVIQELFRGFQAQGIPLEVRKDYIRIDLPTRPEGWKPVCDELPV